MGVDRGAKQKSGPLLRVEGVKKGYPVKKGMMKKNGWLGAGGRRGKLRLISW